MSVPSVGPALPSMKNQGVLRPSWCRSQLHPGMKLRGFQTHSWSCLGICNFQQEDAPAQDSGVVAHLSLLGSEQSLVRQLLEEFSLFYCRQQAGLVSVTRSRNISLPKPFPNPRSRGLCHRAARWDGSTPLGATQTSPSQRGNLQSCPSTSKPGRKNRISANLGLSPKEWHPPAGFCGTPLLCAALQAAELCRQAQGTRQFSALQ